MKEIGGYFGLEQLVSNHYYKDLIALNSGRNALLYLLKAKDIKKIYVPYYLCDSVREVCTRNNVNYELYNIDANFMPIFKKELKDDEYLYIVNYFGQISNNKIKDFNKRHKRVIIDNAQSFFQIPIHCVDTIYTCRKYFGVPDGAFLSTDTPIIEELKIDVSKDRMTHILGRFEGNASDYYRHFQAVEQSFDNETLKCMSRMSYNILGAIDYERVRKIRNKNYLYLNSKLSLCNKLNLSTPDGPHTYPFYMENGIEIRQAIAQKNKIYIPTLWPEVMEHLPKCSIEYQYVANILSLPCDQRYGIEDMDWIIENIKKYI